MLEGPETADGSACFLLNQRIVAHGRIALLEMMEQISRMAPEVEICYVNIDSIHFSVPTINLAATLEALRNQASEEMGSFKIEAVTSHGLWLEPGRYWLYSDKVEKFKNRSIGDQNMPFKDHATHVLSHEIDGLHVPMKMTARMNKSMSATRAMSPDLVANLTRQHLIKIGDDSSFPSILDQLEETRKISIPQKMKAFYDLRRQISGT